jgi:hypothetical protein
MRFGHMMSLDAIDLPLAVPKGEREDAEGETTISIPGASSPIRVDELDGVLRSLSEEDLALVEHRIIREESLRECASQFGTSRQTVANREKTLKARLKTAIEALAH